MSTMARSRNRNFCSGRESGHHDMQDSLRQRSMSDGLLQVLCI